MGNAWYEGVVLASGSPRRREILTRMGVSFLVDVADVDEACEGIAQDVARTVAMRKAEAVAPRHPQAVVLAADTVVEAGGILGKPKDEEDAARMLRLLSDRWHEVYTGVCTIHRGNMRCELAVTRVHFVALTQEDIDRYLLTGDQVDKAGAYGIQGMAGMFIDRIEGCPYNVMGLPMALTKRLLAD